MLVVSVVSVVSVAPIAEVGAVIEVVAGLLAAPIKGGLCEEIVAPCCGIAAGIPAGGAVAGAIL